MPAGLFSWAGAGDGESWESPSDNDRGWRGAGACFLMYNIEKSCDNIIRGHIWQKLIKL